MPNATIKQDVQSAGTLVGAVHFFLDTLNGCKALFFPRAQSPGLRRDESLLRLGPDAEIEPLLQVSCQRDLESLFHLLVEITFLQNRAQTWIRLDPDFLVEP